MCVHMCMCALAYWSIGFMSEGVTSVQSKPATCVAETQFHLSYHNCIGGSALVGSWSQELELAIEPRHSHMGINYEAKNQLWVHNFCMIE